MPYHEILLHQPSVDFIDSSHHVYERSAVDPELLHATTDKERIALNALAAVVTLKRDAGTRADRVVDISNPAIEPIAEGRQNALLFTYDLQHHLSNKLGRAIAQYGLADVKEFSDHVPRIEALHVRGRRPSVHYGQEQFFLRMEESLILQAERLIERAHYGTRTDAVSVSDDILRVRRSDSTITQIPLHGYEFNRHGAEEERVRIAELPSCEAFIGATVLEQIALSSSVIRIIPYWMKDREIHARDLLEAAGHAQLPVLSVIIGKTGDVDKIIRWSDNANELFASSLPYIKERKAHRTSTQAAKQIHDTLFAEHNTLYKTYCRPELATNITPGAIIEDYELLTTRAHEFLSRTLRAAPMYEYRQGRDDNKVTVSTAFAMLSDLFSKDYQNRRLVFPDKPVHITHLPGQNTNDTSYIHAVIASRPEEDPILLKNSAQIDLVAHIVLEQLPADSRHKLEHSRDILSDLRAVVSANELRYCLLEARRTDGTTLPRSKAVRLD